jgi:hypothetical protein
VGRERARCALLLLRGALYGFAICGPKQDHSDYVPDERDVVASLAHRVGIAYEWLTRIPTASLTRQQTSVE